jgi:hypothetical protein
LECGPALVEQGNPAAYERFRQAAIARFTGGSRNFTDRIIKISLLLPAGEPLLQSLRPMANQAAKTFVTNVDGYTDVFLAAWHSVSLALMEYRSGNYELAASWCKRCLNYPEDIAPRTATARAILAMADQHLGKADAARVELGQARAIIEEKFKTPLERGTPMQGFWFDWVFGEILLREATALLPPN